MARPKLYNTDEERLAAGRLRSQRYYSRKRESICEARRNKYEAAKAAIDDSLEKSSGSARVVLTPEEKRLKDRLKSQRYYQRHKSEVKARRQARSGGGGVYYSGAARKAPIPLDKWQQQTAELALSFREALFRNTVKAHMKSITVAYLKSRDRSVITEVYKPFYALRRRVDDLQHEIINSLGCGARLADTNDVLSDINQVVEHLEDLEEVVILDGPAGLMGRYKHGYLRFQWKL